MSRELWRNSQVARSWPTFVWVLAIIFAITTISWERAKAQSSEANAPTVRHVVVILNKSKLIRFAKPIKKASIASTAIADITPMTDRSLYIQGKTPGTTNISVFDENMQLVEIVDLEVTIDTENLQQRIRAITGSNAVRVTASSGQVVLSGMVADGVAADRSVSVAQSMMQGVTLVNAMTVAPSQQVMLEVRFLEASRSAERDIGVNWFGTKPNGNVVSTGVGTANNGMSVTQGGTALLSASGGGPFGVVLANVVNSGAGNLNVMISALESQGLVRRLAEPNLVTLSGETAKFLAGGEFPIPTVSGTTANGATPTFLMQPYGVSLSFVPTVLRNHLINLRIAPEVSELDYANSVTISGTTIPSILQRNAQTTIELRDGQSFAIAGLLQNRSVRNLDQLPWLGSVPVLGSLFRSAAYQNSESDLVIIVTVHLVHPVTPADHLATPFDQRLPSNDVDFFANGQMEIPKRYSDYVTSGGGVQGPYGAIIPTEKGSNQSAFKGIEAK